MADAIGSEGSSSHTTGCMPTRIEVVGRVSGRRRWTVEQKLAILRDAFGRDGSVRAVCERHEVSSGQVYTWRRQAMSGEMAGVQAPALPSFAEVEVGAPLAALVSPPEPASACGQIGIELPCGVRLTVDAGVDADALARVIGVLTR